jgi:hypothetical protein
MLSYSRRGAFARPDHRLGLGQSREALFVQLFTGGKYSPNSRGSQKQDRPSGWGGRHTWASIQDTTYDDRNSLKAWVSVNDVEQNTHLDRVLHLNRIGVVAGGWVRSS